MPWIIDRDYTADPSKPAPSNENAVGMRGPGIYEGDGSELTYEFRMYDGDDELYYAGRAHEETFEPLDDFGAPNAGCTTIRYFRPDTHLWETL